MPYEFLTILKVCLLSRVYNLYQKAYFAMYVNLARRKYLLYLFTYMPALRFCLVGKVSVVYAWIIINNGPKLF
jgi:hypothetical protein